MPACAWAACTGGRSHWEALPPGGWAQHGMSSADTPGTPGLPACPHGWPGRRPRPSVRACGAGRHGSPIPSMLHRGAAAYMRYCGVALHRRSPGGALPATCAAAAAAHARRRAVLSGCAQIRAQLAAVGSPLLGDELYQRLAQPRDGGGTAAAAGNERGAGPAAGAAPRADGGLPQAALPRTSRPEPGPASAANGAASARHGQPGESPAAAGSALKPVSDGCVTGAALSAEGAEGNACRAGCCCGAPGCDTAAEAGRCMCKPNKCPESIEAVPPRRPDVIGLQSWRLEVMDAKGLFGEPGVAVLGGKALVVRRTTLSRVN